jgi:glucose/arabinose dehydrogenase
MITVRPSKTALIATILLAPLWGTTGEAVGLQGSQTELVLETVAKDLEVPWSIDFTPDGRIFVAERIGRIRVVDPDGFKTQLWALLDVVHLRSTGLTGLAVDPDFATTRHIYVLGAFLDEHGRLRNQVRRLTDRNGQGRDPQVVLDSLPWGIVHGIGDLAFGPDGQMYLTVGDTGNVEKSQDRGSLIGKVLGSPLQPRRQHPRGQPLSRLTRLCAGTAQYGGFGLASGDGAPVRG